MDSFNTNLGKQACVAQHNASRNKPAKGEMLLEENGNSSELHHSCLGNDTARECSLAVAERCLLPELPQPSSFVGISRLFLGTVPDHIVPQTLPWAEPKPQP